MKRYDHSLGFRRLLMTHGPHLQAMQDDMDAIAQAQPVHLATLLVNRPGLPVFTGIDMASGEDHTVVVREGKAVEYLRPEDVARVIKNMREATLQGHWLRLIHNGFEIEQDIVNPRTGRKVLQLPRKSRV